MKWTPQFATEMMRRRFVAMVTPLAEANIRRFTEAADAGAPSDPVEAVAYWRRLAINARTEAEAAFFKALE